MAGGIPWLWPLCETLHFIGLALLMAVVGLLDLRMLGFAKDIPLGPLQRLTPWGILGFAINLVTGCCSSSARRRSTSPTSPSS